MKINHFFSMKEVALFLSRETVLLKNFMSRHKVFGRFLAIAFLSLSTTVFAGEDSSLVRYGQDTGSGDMRVTKRGDRKLHNERKRLLRSQRAIDQKAAMNQRRADRQGNRRGMKRSYQKTEKSSASAVSARMSRMHRERNLHQGKITPRPVRPIHEAEIHALPMPYQLDKIEQENKEENTESAALPVIRPDDQEEPVIQQGPLAAPEEHQELSEKQYEDVLSPADSGQAPAEEKDESGELESQVIPEPAAPVFVSEETEEERASSSMTEDEKRERLNELEAQLKNKRSDLDKIDHNDWRAYQIQGLYLQEEALNKDIAEIEAEIKSLR